MSDRVPWHRSLFLRLFALGAAVAVVAVAAATWATVRSTAVAVHQEQQQSLHADATTYDSLIGYAATHRSWSGAGTLVDRLAQRSGHRVSVTDEAGHILLDSTGATGPLPSTQARATLDALAVDTALLSTSTPPPSPSPSPAVQAADCGADGCVLVVASASTIDPRVRGPFSDTNDRATWATLQQRIDSCLDRAGLPPVLAVKVDFSVLVSFPKHHAQVARCVDDARRAMLTRYVAPRALLFIGADDATADVFWDLSQDGRLRIGLLAAAVLGVTLLLSALLAGYVVRPLRRLATAARQAGDGDLAVRVEERRGDEIGQMARAFNRMADRRQQLEEARRRMVSDVSHELRNPLANIRGWLEAAQDGLAAPNERLLASLHEETTHLQRLVDDLHELSVGDAGELRLAPEPIDLTAFVQQVADTFRAAAETGGVTLTAETAPGVDLLADPVRLRQALGNLLVNALRHTPPGGRIRITGAPGAISVSDTGEGIPAADLPYVFDRFRRVDASRSRATGGSGLGLAIVRQIVEAHGGTAEIASTRGQGTTVTLRFP
jgi:two-component system sensor histidine kinase BaeS